MRNFVKIFLILILLAPAAHARIEIEKQLYQSGVFYDLGVTGHAETICQSHIFYPQIISGIRADLAAKLNNYFRFYADKIKCSGVLVQGKQAEDLLINAQSFGMPIKSTKTDFVLAHADEKILSIMLTKQIDDGTSEPLIHHEGVNYDLVKSRPLRLVDLLNPKYVEDVKLAVYDQLKEKAGAKKQPKDFLASSECEGCTFVISPQGLKIVFQPYALDMIGAKRADIQVPGKYVIDNYIGLIISGAAN